MESSRCKLMITGIGWRPAKIDKESLFPATYISDFRDLPPVTFLI